MNMSYSYTVVKYYQMSCSMTVRTMNILITVIVVVVVVSILGTYIGISIYKKIKYSKLLREKAISNLKDEDYKLLDENENENEAEYDMDDLLVTI